MLGLIYNYTDAESHHKSVSLSTQHVASTTGDIELAVEQAYDLSLGFVERSQIRSAILDVKFTLADLNCLLDKYSDIDQSKTK